MSVTTVKGKTHHSPRVHPHLVSEKSQPFQIQSDAVAAIEKKTQFQAKIKTTINILGNYLCVEKGSSSDCRSHISGGHHQNSCSLLAGLPLLHSWHFFNEGNLCRRWPRDTRRLLTNGPSSPQASFPTTIFAATDAHLCLGPPRRTGWKRFFCPLLFVGFTRCQRSEGITMVIYSQIMNW